MNDEQMQNILDTPVADGETVYWQIVFGFNSDDDTIRKLMVEEIVRTILAARDVQSGEQEREAFEVWASEALEAHYDESDCLKTYDKESAWLAWQARAALSSPAIQSAKPVAWQYENQHGNPFLTHRDPATWHPHDRAGFKNILALYSHSAPASQSDEPDETDMLSRAVKHAEHSVSIDDYVSQSAENRGASVTPAEFDTAIETLRHVIHSLRTTANFTDEEGEATDYLEPLLEARLAPPSQAEKRGEDESDAVRHVIAERARQMSQEGWTPEHDDEHATGELAEAAAAYASEAAHSHAGLPNGWPWSRAWWKPGTPRQNLVKAGALILAEIERLDRHAALPKSAEGAKG